MLHVSALGILVTLLQVMTSVQQQTCKVGNPSKNKKDGNEFPECDNGIENCGTETCSPGFDYCYTVYKKRKKDGNLKPIYASCWDNKSPGDTCHQNKCVMRYRPSFKMYGCCCTGPLCNLNLIFPAEINNTTETTTTLTKTNEPNEKGKYYLYYVLASIFLSIMLTGAALYFWVKRKRGRLDDDILLADFDGTSPAQLPALMIEILHEGQMSVIWKGSYCQRHVAIKVINKHNHHLWLTEKDLFVKYKLRHKNLLNFICAEKRYHESSIQYWIVTEFHDYGSLADYLYQYTLTKDTLLKMLYCIIKGLVYLHSDNHESGKPMVAHRDLKPGNILVKKDLSCCISDLGLALALPENIKVSRDLCQAGTKRYMAPEILQGAITFHPESFLRADMYAMGLVMWELFSRTKLDDLEDDGKVAPYQPPYFDHVNFNPSIDEMLKCVVENHERPCINPEWRKTQALDSISATIERCWDDDGDARLTAHCVEERIKHLIHSPPDNTFDLMALERLKEKRKEDSCDSAASNISCHSALIIEKSRKQSISSTPTKNGSLDSSLSKLGSYQSRLGVVV